MVFRKVLLLMLLCLSSTILLPSRFLEAKTEGNIIRVPNDFSTIQEAIDRANPGGTVIVNVGVYHEHLAVNKTLSLIGADRMGTVIDADKNGTAVTVSADNVFVDGFTLRDGGGGDIFSAGIFLNESSNCTVSDNIVTSNAFTGIYLYKSSNNTIRNNVVPSNGFGPYDGFESGAGASIALIECNGNTVSGNVVSDSLYFGINVDHSNDTLIEENVMKDNGPFTTILTHCNAVILHHNCFLDSDGVYVAPNSYNISWDDDMKGNYWAGYTGLDDGSNGRVAGDGVGDTDLSFIGLDNYPLINPPIPIQVLWQNVPYPVTLRGNSTISSFDFSQTDKQVSFGVTGPMNTTGYFNLSIPTSLLSGPWTILLDRADVTSKAMITENQTYTTIRLSYNHSSHSIQMIGTQVIPEYLTATTLLLLLVFTLPLTTLAAKKREKNKHMPIRKSKIVLA